MTEPDDFKMGIDFNDLKKVLDDLINKQTKPSETINKTPDKIELTKEQFCFLLRFVQKLQAEFDKFTEVIEPLFEDFFGILKISGIVSELTKWLSEQMSDADGQYDTTIGWWLYEMQDFAEADQVITFHDVPFPVRTPEELYDCLVKINQGST
jgi:hypothetical protein